MLWHNSLGCKAAQEAEKRGAAQKDWGKCDSKAQVHSLTTTEAKKEAIREQERKLESLQARVSEALYGTS